jgi:hypothetical protein
MLSCEEVKIYLHDYVDELLDNSIKKEIEVHIRTCETCLARYKKITSFFDKLKDLQEMVEVPGDIRENLSAELLKKSLSQKVDDKPVPKVNLRKIKKEQAKFEKSLKQSRGAARKSMVSKTIIASRHSIPLALKHGKLNFKKTFHIFLPLIIIGAGYLIYNMLQMNSPWDVEAKFGSFLIDGKRNQAGKLDKGESLKTEDSSKVVVYIPRTGRIELNSKSVLILEKPRNRDNRVSLKNGSIKIITTAMIPYITVDLKNYLIRDVGGVFSVNLDEYGNTNVFVDFGMVEIFYKNHSFLLDEGYNCELHPGKRPGTPYRFDASDSLKILIRQFDLKSGDNSLVEKIVDVANQSDALTLLSLIPRVSQIKRQILYQKISDYFPPPDNVTSMGIITLDQDMIEEWWNEIEWQI